MIPKIFGKVHCKCQKVAEDSFSDDFKMLFEKMTYIEAKKRLTIEEVKKSAWYKGPIYSPEELSSIMRKKMFPEEVLGM